MKPSRIRRAITKLHQEAETYHLLAGQLAQEHTLRRGGSGYANVALLLYSTKQVRRLARQAWGQVGLCYLCAWSLLPGQDSREPFSITQARRLVREMRTWARELPPKRGGRT